ncbi:MAG: Rhamnulokinase [bacterium ADurb.Bin429]|nr:MAG: Rhamnulokinase [bacterium ADurb.Bin429]
MNTCALAVDLGASSGRHILGRLENGSMVTEEIYRFSNGMEKKDGRLCWDTQALIGHIVEGMKRCGQAGYRPVSVGIDTWGVDYALLDGEGTLAAPVTAYRDSRTALMPARLEERMAARELYAHTGIAAQEYNTVYQLMTERAEPDRTLLFMPCYLSWLLCGV